MIELLFLPGNYKASASISFDFETSAQSPPITIKGTLKTALLGIGNKIGVIQRDMSSRYGRGYSNRKGAEKILNLFSELNIHGTWVATGHVLMKGNRNRKEYLTNVPLPYATKESGFTDATTWRKDKKSFCHEPFSDYTQHPNYYLGDLAEKMRIAGEDIQCHSFSHPYMSMEDPENIYYDLNEWQSTAQMNGFTPASIFAFPFLGDAYYLDKKQKYIPFKAPQQSALIFLTNDQLAVFKKCGFELFTRCLTSEKAEIFQGFKPYFGSDIYYMKDMEILGFQDDDNFTNFLNQMTAIGATIDFWLHPNDVYDQESFELFKFRVKKLHKLSLDGELWLTTIKEQWCRFKGIKQIEYNYQLQKNSFIILNVINKSHHSIENVAFNCLDDISTSHKGLRTCGKRLIIEKLEAGEGRSISLKVEQSLHE